MVDFINPEYIRLNTMSKEKAEKALELLLVPEEEILIGFKTIRDKVIFTSKRIVAINVQGVTGKKIAYTSIPYTKIQAFAIETAGAFDMEGELNIWVSSVGKIHFEIASGCDIRKLNQVLSEYIM